jgi:NADPH:quinone reductase-like Zn-dependent oxidoreductase
MDWLWIALVYCSLNSGITEMSSAQWTLQGQNGIESLKFARVPIQTALGQHEVLVELRAASLNYRDVVIAKVRYPQTIIMFLSHTFSGPPTADSSDIGHAWP